MEYLLAILGLGVLCGCALGAYGVLDAVEAEEESEADHGRAAERVRALRADGASPPRRVAALRPPVRLATGAYADWLEGRVRGLEERLDQLVCDYLRLEGPVRETAAISPAPQSGPAATAL
jgi:hypothetical protein